MPTQHVLVLCALPGLRRRIPALLLDEVGDKVRVYGRGHTYTPPRAALGREPPRGASARVQHAQLNAQYQLLQSLSRDLTPGLRRSRSPRR